MGNLFRCGGNAPQLLAQGELIIASTNDPGVLLPLEVNAAYMLIAVTVNKTTGAFRCYRERIIYTSLRTDTGVPVYAQVDNGSGGTGTVSFTYATTDVESFSVTIKPSSVSYNLRYSFFKLSQF